MPETPTEIAEETQTFDLEDALYVVRDGLDLLGTVEQTNVSLSDGEVLVATDRGHFVAAVRLENAASLECLDEAHGGHWGNHPDYPAEDWRIEVEAQNTRLGYWDWVEAKISDAAAN